MTDDPVARARLCLGARFRVHGRDPARGLDCVGLVAFAYGIDGVPAGYPLRGGSAEAIEAGLTAFGFVRSPAQAGVQLRDGIDTGPRPSPGNGDEGEVLLLEAGPFQHHLAIATPSGFVHADAGLRRVVAVPGRPRWPILSRWQRK